MEQGKWYVANTSNGQGLIIEENTGKNIAVSYDEADAQLIASAPELLAACKNCVIDAQQNLTKSERLQRVKFTEQAIARAEEE